MQCLGAGARIGVAGMLALCVLSACSLVCVKVSVCVWLSVLVDLLEHQEGRCFGG